MRQYLYPIINRKDISLHTYNNIKKGILKHNDINLSDILNYIKNTLVKRNRKIKKNIKHELQSLDDMFHEDESNYKE